MRAPVQLEGAIVAGCGDGLAACQISTADLRHLRDVLGDGDLGRPVLGINLVLKLDKPGEGVAGVSRRPDLGGDVIEQRVKP